jgi:CBS domain-containing protein
MQRDVATLRPDDHLDLADDVMRLGRIRHLPVLEKERVVGIVTQRDLLSVTLAAAFHVDPAQRRSLVRVVEARDVMTKDVVSVGTGTTLAQAAQVMLEHKIGCLPVLSGEGWLVGLVTESDLLRAAYLDEEEEGVMAKQTVEKGDWRERLDHEIDELRRLRDELKVRIHLGKADARDLWERLDKRFHEVEAQVKRTAQRSEAPLHEMGEASRKLLDELRAGYHELRKQL